MTEPSPPHLHREGSDSDEKVKTLRGKPEKRHADGITSLVLVFWVSSGCSNKIPRGRWLKWQMFLSDSSGGWHISDQGTSLSWQKHWGGHRHSVCNDSFKRPIFNNCHQCTFCKFVYKIFQHCRVSKCMCWAWFLLAKGAVFWGLASFECGS